MQSCSRIAMCPFPNFHVRVQTVPMLKPSHCQNFFFLGGAFEAICTEIKCNSLEKEGNMPGLASNNIIYVYNTNRTKVTKNGAVVPRVYVYFLSAGGAIYSNLYFIFCHN